MRPMYARIVRTNRDVGSEDIPREGNLGSVVAKLSGVSCGGEEEGKMVEW
jgi:hypothetical protein